VLDELQLTYTSYNGQNLNSPAVSVIRGSTVYGLFWLDVLYVFNSKMGMNCVKIRVNIGTLIIDNVFIAFSLLFLYVICYTIGDAWVNEHGVPVEYY
jgi:hypothetical protein